MGIEIKKNAQQLQKERRSGMIIFQKSISNLRYYEI